MTKDRLAALVAVSESRRERDYSSLSVSLSLSDLTFLPLALRVFFHLYLTHVTYAVPPANRVDTRTPHALVYTRNSRPATLPSRVLNVSERANLRLSSCKSLGSSRVDGLIVGTGSARYREGVTGGWQASRLLARADRCSRCTDRYLAQREPKVVAVVIVIVVGSYDVETTGPIVVSRPGPWRPWPTLSLIGEERMNGERIPHRRRLSGEASNIVGARSRRSHVHSWQINRPIRKMYVSIFVCQKLNFFSKLCHLNSLVNVLAWMSSSRFA